MDIKHAPLLTLYGRGYCHLCEDMEAALLALRGEFDFELEVIDVDSSPSHETQFGERIPVLMHGDTELCHYFLDRPAVRRYLSALTGTVPGEATS